MSEPRVRILRILSYEGPLSAIAEHMKRVVHGEKTFGQDITLKAATIGTFPEILEMPEEET